ncbi:MAG: hypothetical protein KJP19_06500 [Deltaproteobacteria bacterium]|nr:hypothetical protein [Deltaproteobacteria bacterium]
MSTIDDVTLSCYLDGELDYARATNVTDQIHGDEKTRDRFVSMATAHGLLRAYGQMEAREEIPPKPVQALKKSNRRTVFFLEQKTIFQIAAVLVLFIASYLIGRQNSVERMYKPSLVPVIPAALEHTINTVLEYQKSGSTQDWVQMEDGMSAKITPVQSFRGSEGTFYRMYLIDMSGNGETQKFWAMASRKGKENWLTKGVFATDTPGSI